MKSVRILSEVVLTLLGLSALTGSIPMIAASLAKAQGPIPLSVLEHTPFHSFLVPGILLLGANGLLAFLALWMVVKRKPHYGLWIAFQGCVLLGWIVIQCILLRTVVSLHILYGSVALLLITSGLILRKEPSPGRYA
jgi:hypothetical protein